MKRGSVTCVLLAAALLLASGTGLRAQKLTEEQMTAYRTRPAVVLIYSGLAVEFTLADGKEQTLPVYGSGSGFFINPDGYLVTNGHVVDSFVKYTEDKDGYARKVLDDAITEKVTSDYKAANGREPGQQELQQAREEFIRKNKPQVTGHEGINYVLLSNSETLRFEVKKFSPSIPDGGKDISILKVERDNCPVVMLGDSSTLALQQPVFTIGFPGVVNPDRFPLLAKENTLKSSITRGAISALKTDYKGMAVIQHDSATSPGNSGGPTVTTDGRVIGVHSYAATGADGFKFCVPINAAKEFIRDAGVDYNKTADFTVVYNKLLQSVWDERWFDAQTQVSTALAYMKNEPDLEQLQRRILQHISEMGFFEKLWRQNRAVVIIAVILLAAILVVLYMSFKPVSGGQLKPAASVPAAPAPVGSAPPAGGMPAPAPPAVPSDKTSIEPSDGTLFEGDIRGSVTVIVKGQEQGTYPITTTSMVLGRDAASSTVAIQSDLVSKNHLKVYPKDDQFYIVDLGSTNGTYVNGERITEQLVKPEDSVQLGKKGEVKLVFKK